MQQRTIPVDLDDLLLPTWVGLLIRVGAIAFPVHIIADDQAAFDLALIVLIDVGLSNADVLRLVTDPAHALSRVARRHGRAWTSRRIAQTRRELERKPVLTAEALLRLTDPSAMPSVG